MNMIVNQDDFNGLVNSSLKTNSRIIAEKFEKEHRNVMRDIRALIDANPDWGLLNFEQTPYVDAQNGQTYQMHEMTRDGYSMLVMGFTGKKAMDWKIKFLAAFNAMAEQLKRTAVLSGPQLMAAALIEANATMSAQSIQIEAMKPKVEAYDDLMNADGLYGLQNAGRALSARPNLFVRWLKQDYLFYRGNALVARTQFVQRGYFEVRSKIIDETARPETFVTPKGLLHLRDKVPSEILIRL
ncbi:antirepressor protein [Ketogulonicigenium robustum]|uniref:Antirepressor protein n=1 Tax=Ketogulonicigenium robustum TaxID=92947 RepID=A0A1W6NZ19_9RHOB|nr:phage regulatory protein/antirepressor Ant [Ketogulonicigenium robustum]ARO14439.1 antirepressor protein [Ketogulonicigenium robustum]